MLFVYGVSVNVRYFFFDFYITKLTKIEQYAPVLVLPTFAFWIAMLRDYFLIRRDSAAGYWRWVLIIFNWGAAFIYFIKVWRPAHDESNT